MRTLIRLLLFFWSASFVSWGTTYYAATNGSSSNSGLSTNSPWPLAYALANAGASNTIILMSGTYSAGTAMTVTSPGQTIQAQVKWGAFFPNWAGTVFDTTPNVTHYTTFDGLSFSNCQYHGIVIRNGLSNCVVRNCWAQYTGVYGWAASQSSSGFDGLPAYNTLFENNLCEHNGNSQGFDHGIYAGGTNIVIRNNVCRYNDGYGIQIENTLTGDDAPQNCQVYNNLCYGNLPGSFSGAGQGQLVFYSSSGNGNNAIYGNTFITTNGGVAIEIQASSGIYSITNNIIISTNLGIVIDAGSPTIHADYNLAPRALGYTGPHDVVTNYFGFVNTNNGLYWLAANSPARGKALSTIAGPVDFFGNAQLSVADIGAFQYNAAYASDSQVLDPSPANPDYWANLVGTNGGTASITVTPASQDFGSIPVGTTADQTFTVQNIGSATLSGSVSVSAPFSIVSGGSYNLTAGLSQVVTVRYSPTTAGSNTATVAFTGGTLATASVSGTATIVPPVVPVVTFQAPSGSLSSPFVATNGYIYQPVTTDVTSGGQAVYNFTITNAGNYGIQALVNAPNVGANSFYINIDAQPQDPTMIWDVPVTTGFEQRMVSWRGNGADGSDQFVPWIFSLSVGTHQLVIVGLEANTQLEQLSILGPPLPPQNLRPILPVP